MAPRLMSYPLAISLAGWGVWGVWGVISFLPSPSSPSSPSDQKRKGYKPPAVAHGGNPQDRAALRIYPWKGKKYFPYSSPSIYRWG